MGSLGSLGTSGTVIPPAHGQIHLCLPILTVFSPETNRSSSLLSVSFDFYYLPNFIKGQK